MVLATYQKQDYILPGRACPVESMVHGTWWYTPPAVVFAPEVHSRDVPLPAMELKSRRCFMRFALPGSVR